MLTLVVSDHGPGIGAMAFPDVAFGTGYSTAGTLGMGYKVMIHFADRVYLATGPEGTTVAIEMGLHKAPATIPDALRMTQHPV
jgi:anti-sigma regulatory factor (Ser/Thr protein kinase)